MNLRDVINALVIHADIEDSNIIINDIPLANYDVMCSEFLTLLNTPVYLYQNTGEGKVVIETMWS